MAIVVMFVVGCTPAPEPAPGDLCSPASGDCSDELACCSIDAAALELGDLSALVLPIFPGHNEVGGVALFADANNSRSRRGLCVDPDAVPPAGRLSNGCPIPCNPTWSTADIQSVCGSKTICCQYDELSADDCVLDPSVGDSGCWRPATGADIGTLSSWAADEHTTHQDPGVAADGACAMLAAGVPPELDATSVREACERRLSVANQQGVCLPSANGNYCPYAQASYRDACERMNDEQSRSGCEAVESP